MSKRSSEKLHSLINILSQLEGGNIITASILAESLSVSERTIYRYMMSLQVAGYPIYFDHDKMTYRFVDGYALKQKGDTSEINRVLELKSHILGASPVGLLSYDSTGQCVYVNEAASSIIGATRVQALGQNYFELDSWVKSGMLVMAEEVMRTGVEVNNDVHILTTFGRDIWLHCNMSRFSSGGKQFLLLVVQDFTERVRMEQALKESEEILSLFVEYNPSYTFIKDDDLKFVQLSINYEQLLGKPLDQIIGKNMYELFPSEFADKLIREDSAVLESGQKIEIEEEYQGRYFTTIKFPFTRSGKKFLAGYAIDVTERKKNE